jgi:hypothetical protein
MNMQDQGTDFIRQGQAAWTNVTDSWTQTMQRMFTKAPGGSIGAFDVNRAVDSWFDFAESLLAVQREYVKNIARAATSIQSTISEQAEHVGGAVRRQADTTIKVVREQANQAQQTARAEAKRGESDARERAANSYSDMTKTQLQEQLAEQDLPKTGTVEELRERLVDARLQGSSV